MMPHIIINVTEQDLILSNRYSYLSYICSECEFTNCVCNSLIIGIDNTNSERHNEVSQISD